MALFDTYLSFAIIAVSAAALVLSAALYAAFREKASLLGALLFAAFLLHEFCTRDTELAGAFFLFLDRIFNTGTILPFVLLYCAIAAALLLLAGEYLRRDTRFIALMYGLFYGIWSICFLLLKVDIGTASLLLFLPNQALLLCLSVVCILRSRRSSAPDRLLRVFLYITAAFSVLIILEDATLLAGLSSRLPPRFVPSIRNRAESVFHLLFSVGAIWFMLRFIRARTAERSGRLPGAAAFAAHLGLSDRETEVLALLLTDRSNSEICEALHISMGTVKAHTHNIYQKAEVERRTELRDCFRQFQNAPSGS